MSYDLAVFDPASAPVEPAAFLGWYRKQVAWQEERDYNSTDGTSPCLVSLFEELQRTFPSLNGSADTDENLDDEHITDYGIGSAIIYAAFSWSVAEEAYELLLRLAKKYGVGFFDASGSEGLVVRP